MESHIKHKSLFRSVNENIKIPNWGNIRVDENVGTVVGKCIHKVFLTLGRRGRSYRV